MGSPSPNVTAMKHSNEMKPNLSKHMMLLPSHPLMPNALRLIISKLMKTKYIYIYIYVHTILYLEKAMDIYIIVEKKNKAL